MGLHQKIYSKEDNLKHLQLASRTAKFRIKAIGDIILLPMQKYLGANS